MRKPFPFDSSRSYNPMWYFTNLVLCHVTFTPGSCCEEELFCAHEGVLSSKHIFMHWFKE